ncbi:MAG: hypothetical protein HY481_02040 [Candidatus Vogelbacteria bacterium]|nr:hypothetical protein [Candidatus Vogelbacteria bacterium]
MEKEIGKVIHWYDKIGVAVVKLSGGLKVGDNIGIKHGQTEFTDAVVSMQLDHQPIESGQPGQEVAIKLSQTATKGAVIYQG